MSGASEAMASIPEDMKVQWWLAELDQYGNPRLCDGAHSERAGADKAFQLRGYLGLIDGRRFVVVRVELSEPSSDPQPVNEEAIASLNAIGLRS